MKEEMIRKAIGGIDSDLIEDTEKTAKTARKGVFRIRWGFAAAAVILIAALGVLLLPGMFKTETPAVTPDTQPINGEGAGVGDPNYHGSEIGMYEVYDYSVDTGKYSSYVKGRVISDTKVGDKLGDVTVTAGWVRAEGLPQAEKEHARAEIFEIKDISADVAVAIKFVDELEAQLTTCYYVIMNPDADLTPVQDYIIEHNPAGMLDGGEMIPPGNSTEE